MMLRSGMRYLRVCGGARGGYLDGDAHLLVRALASMAPDSRVSASCRARAVAVRLAASCPLSGARSNCGAVRFCSSRTSKDSKETAPLTGGASSCSCSSSSSVKTQNESEEDLEKELELEQQPAEPQSQQVTWRQRAKTFAIEYGRVGIATHIVLSLLSFSVIYVGVSSGVDVSALLESIGFSSSVSDTTTNSAGSALIAYTIYKVVAPIRWPITFAVTPVVLRALRRRGYMLPASHSSSSRPPTSP